MVIEQDGSLLFINTSETDAISGNYLIGIDGRLSVNSVQRLPGKQLAISFDGNQITVSESDIEVKGRVAMVMGRG
nr:bacteriocin [Veronia pacifica]